MSRGAVRLTATPARGRTRPSLPRSAPSLAAATAARARARRRRAQSRAAAAHRGRARARAGAPRSPARSSPRERSEVVDAARGQHRVVELPRAGDVREELAYGHHAPRLLAAAVDEAAHRFEELFQIREE